MQKASEGTAVQIVTVSPSSNRVAGGRVGADHRLHHLAGADRTLLAPAGRGRSRRVRAAAASYPNSDGTWSSSRTGSGPPRAGDGGGGERHHRRRRRRRRPASVRPRSGRTIASPGGGGTVSPASIISSRAAPGRVRRGRRAPRPRRRRPRPPRGRGPPPISCGVRSAWKASTATARRSGSMRGEACGVRPARARRPRAVGPPRARAATTSAARTTGSGSARPLDRAPPRSSRTSRTDRGARRPRRPRAARRRGPATSGAPRRTRWKSMPAPVRRPRYDGGWRSRCPSVRGRRASRLVDVDVGLRLVGLAAAGRLGLLRRLVVLVFGSGSSSGSGSGSSVSSARRGSRPARPTSGSGSLVGLRLGSSAAAAVAAWLSAAPELSSASSAVSSRPRPGRDGLGFAASPRVRGPRCRRASRPRGSRLRASRPWLVGLGSRRARARRRLRFARLGLGLGRLRCRRAIRRTTSAARRARPDARASGLRAFASGSSGSMSKREPPAGVASRLLGWLGRWLRLVGADVEQRATRLGSVSAGFSARRSAGSARFGSSVPMSNSEEPPLALAAGPTSSVSVTVSAVWVWSPGSGSARVSSDFFAAGAAAAAPAFALVAASPFTEASSICATSRTSTSSRASPLACCAVRPSESITRQNGQPTAIWSAPVPTASAVRFSLIRVADGLLHPHPRAAGAAAEGPLGVALHLRELGAGQHLRAARAAGCRRRCGGRCSTGRGR